MRAAAYLRVSTDGQTNDNQRLAVERFCVERQWSLVRTYEETISGAAKRRPAFDKLMHDAASGRGAGWDVLVIVALDRLTRAGARAALEALERLGGAGLKVASIREPWLDTSGPFGDVLVAFAATFAKLERATLVERTKAGLARAVAEGKTLGRPRAPGVEEAVKLWEQFYRESTIGDGERWPWPPRLNTLPFVNKAARGAGVSPATLRRAILQKFKKGS